MNKKAKIGLIILAFIISILSTKAYATNGKVNQETVRMRKEASTDSSIVTLVSLNEEVEVLSEEGEWYKIKYKTYTGYVRKDMLTVEGTVQNKTTENSQNTTTSNETTNNETNTGTETSNTVASNEESNVTAENTATTTENEENKNQIQTGFTGKISEKIDLKIVPSINSSNIYSINENTEIKIKDIMNKWCYVETETNSGWALKSKIKVQENTKTEENKKEETAKAEENTTIETEKKEEKSEEKTEQTKTEEKKEETKKNVETTKYVSAETLNMREKADNTANIVSQLKINAKVTVLETTGTWSKIKVNGKTGYVASKYLSDKKVEASSRSENLTRTSEQTKEIEKASSKSESKKTNTETTSTSSGTTSGNSVVSYAKQYLGCKYVSGGSSPTTGFDCSGFTSYVYKHFGISISRSSGAQASNGTAVSKSNLQAGDLVIFNNRSNTAIGHVGIYIGGNTFIHAGNSGTGVITTSLSDSYYSSRYVTGRRIIN